MKSSIFITVKKELRAFVRDKKSLILMLAMPFIIPLYILGFSYLYDSILKDTEDSTENVEKTNYVIGVNYDLNKVESDIFNELGLEAKFYSSMDALKNAYNKDEIKAFITYDNTNYEVYMNEMDEQSSIAGSSVISYLDMYNDYLAQNYLMNIGADINKVYNNVSYEVKSLEGSNYMLDILISAGFMFTIMTIMLTAINTTTDSTAGEKERGTLETFLTFPITSGELVTGKYLAIVIACIITSILDLILLVGSITFAYNTFDIFDGALVNINIYSIAVAFLVLVSFSIFVSGLSIAIASFTKSFKEAQSALTPINFLAIIPMFLTMAEVKLNYVISCIPIISHTYMLQDLFFNNVDIGKLIIMFITTVIYTIVIIKVISKIYKSEKILFATN